MLRVSQQISVAAIVATVGVALNVNAAVSVLGVDNEIAANVLLLLRLDEAACEEEANRVTRQLIRSENRILEALEAFGYYRAEIDYTAVPSGNCWDAQINVDTGPRVTLRTVDIQLSGDAEADSAFGTRLAQTSLRSGAPLLHREYDQLKASLTNLAIERGYRDARFATAKIDVYPEETVADIELRFDSGQRYRFGEVQFGEVELDHDLLAGYLNIAPGEFFDSRLLAETRLELINSGYFNTVSVRTDDPDSETGEIPVVLDLELAPRTWISYGIGFSTDTGPRFRFGRNIRRFNSAGHQLTINGLISPVVAEASANYRLPYGDPSSEWLSFDLGGKREDTETSTSRSIQFGARRVVERSDDWLRTDFLSYLVEDFEVGVQNGRSRLLVPGVEWTMLRADNAVRPDRGVKLEIQLRGARDGFAADASFSQLEIRGKWIWSVPAAGRVLVRTQVGRTWHDNFLDLPPSVRFFAGGDSSVRGFDFETLGPLDASGVVIGGSRLVTSSVEYEKRIRPSWSVALFADAGNAFGDGSSNIRRSLGVGARWLSPVGPIRVDIARPANGVDRDLRLHISLGPDL